MSADPKLQVNPWVPMSRPIDLKHVGKLGEEAGELGSACARAMIQGIDACEPVTGKPNRQWLQEEIADVLANIDLVIGHFGLDQAAIGVRMAVKADRLRLWHAMLNE